MRQALIIFAVLWALGASGQIYIDSYRFGAAPAGLLLDDYPSTGAAYSLRKLRNAQTDCMVVRRASNNDTLLIGFVGDYADTAAMKTFCSGTNCFVRRWYDQSGQGLDATQTTDANQPQVIASGALIRFNGTPCISIVDASGTAFTQHMVIPLWHTASATNVWSFAVTGVPTGSSLNFSLFLNSDPGDRGFILAHGATTAYSPFRTFTNRGGTFRGPAQFTVTLGTTYLRVDQANRTNLNIWVNSVAGTSATDSNVDFTMPTNYVMGNTPIIDSRNNLRVIEMIFYPTDQSSNRTTIQSNINSFYNIY